jgi:hypothetical protein
MVNPNGTASSQLWSQVEMLDQQITNEVLCILGKISSGISDVVETFRNGVYRWLLVLDVVNLKARVWTNLGKNLWLRLRRYFFLLISSMNYRSQQPLNGES